MHKYFSEWSKNDNESLWPYEENRKKKVSITPTNPKMLTLTYHKIIYEHINYIIKRLKFLKRKQWTNISDFYISYILYANNINLHWTISWQDTFVSKIICILYYIWYRIELEPYIIWNHRHFSWQTWLSWAYLVPLGIIPSSLLAYWITHTIALIMNALVRTTSLLPLETRCRKHFFFNFSPQNQKKSTHWKMIC